ncbi:MAG: hypothetical protein M0P64_03075 [Candidatus Pacebacteria bacterium]|nr:hypothetical protein [Candidatus Paceibacterota bacterium]
MNHPNCYLTRGKDSIASARKNLERVRFIFCRDSNSSSLDYATLYYFWAQLEKFWWWFKQFNRGGWTREEEELRAAMTVVTLRHYPDMSRQQIEDEIKTVFATFLVERGDLSKIDEERRVRFRRYIQSLLVSLG